MLKELRRIFMPLLVVSATLCLTLSACTTEAPDQTAADTGTPTQDTFDTVTEPEPPAEEPGTVIRQCH